MQVNRLLIIKENRQFSLYEENKAEVVQGTEGLEAVEGTKKVEAIWIYNRTSLKKHTLEKKTVEMERE